METTGIHVNPNEPQFEKYWRERIARETAMLNHDIEFFDWVQYGIDRKWSTEIFCETHDGGPFTQEEYKQWDDGEDPCAQMIRIW